MIIDDVTGEAEHQVGAAFTDGRVNACKDQRSIELYYLILPRYCFPGAKVLDMFAGMRKLLV